MTKHLESAACISLLFII